VSIVHNEQTKPTATALNNVAVATVIAGFLGPIVALVLDSRSVQTEPSPFSQARLGFSSDGSYISSRGSSYSDRRDEAA
jgi:hypothetical protein